MVSSHSNVHINISFPPIQFICRQPKTNIHKTLKKYYFHDSTFASCVQFFSQPVVHLSLFRVNQLNNKIERKETESKRWILVVIHVLKCGWKPTKEIREWLSVRNLIRKSIFRKKILVFHLDFFLDLADCALRRNGVFCVWFFSLCVSRNIEMLCRNKHGCWLKYSFFLQIAVLFGEKFAFIQQKKC